MDPPGVEAERLPEVPRVWPTIVAWENVPLSRLAPGAKVVAPTVIAEVEMNEKLPARLFWKLKPLKSVVGVAVVVAFRVNCAPTFEIEDSAGCRNENVTVAKPGTALAGRTLKALLVVEIVPPVPFER